jgi:recombinational DNA repair protein (RecF pathway)
MTEYLTQAVVLGLEPRKENDRLADLYTKEFGRLEARVIGGRKVLSKLAPHLEILNLVTVRLVEKKSITLTDVLSDENFTEERKRPGFYPEFLKILFLVRMLTPKVVPDAHLWHYLVRSLRSGEGDIKALLRVLGYDPEHADCDSCGRRPVKAFHPKNQAFFCGECGFKAPPNEIIYF